MLPRVIRLLYTVIVVFALMYVLLERRYSMLKTIFITGISFLSIATLNIFLLLDLGYDAYIQFVPMTALLPMTATYMLLSKYRDLRLLFQILTCYSFCIMAVSIGALAFTQSGGNVWVDVATRTVVYLIAFLFIAKFFRKPYLAMAQVLQKGWLLLCLVPLSFYGAFYFLTSYPVSITKRPESVPVLIFIDFSLILFYIFIYIFFHHVLEQYAATQDKQILSTEIKALQNQLELGRQNEEQVRILRHDLRHYIHILSNHLNEQNYEEALRFIGSLEQKLDEVAVERYCTNPTLNAIFSFYFQLAKTKRIEIESNLNLPAKLSVNEMDLSIVFANAIENAIHACEKLENGNRKIRLIAKYTKQGQLIVEIANPCKEKLKFDQDGLPFTGPLSGEHGIGTRSIRRFAQKYHALLNCKLENGWFVLQLLIQEGKDGGTK